MKHNHSNSHNQLPLWLMLLCCALPLVLILGISVFGLSLGSLAAWLPFAMILLCPLSMFWMMRGMMQEYGSAATHHVETPRAISTGPQVKRASTNDFAP